jgi:hypothetical protein
MQASLLLLEPQLARYECSPVAALRKAYEPGGEGTHNKHVLVCMGRQAEDSCGYPAAGLRLLVPNSSSRHAGVQPLESLPWVLQYVCVMQSGWSVPLLLEPPLCHCGSVANPCECDMCLTPQARMTAAQQWALAVVSCRLAAQPAMRLRHMLPQLPHHMCCHCGCRLAAWVVAEGSCYLPV